MRYALAAVAVLLGSIATAVSAESCLDEITKMAREHNLALAGPSTGQRGDVTPPMAGDSPPVTMDSRGAASDTMVATGGVITPPNVGGAGIVIQPPRGTGSAMSTMPQIPPQTGSGSSSPPNTAPDALAAADRAKVEASLSAARAAAAQGRSDQCFQHLREAQAVLKNGG
jgi:hypothetical protein